MPSGRAVSGVRAVVRPYGYKCRARKACAPAGAKETPRRARASSKAAAADLEFWVLCGDSGAQGCFLSFIIYREVLILIY